MKKIPAKHGFAFELVPIADPTFTEVDAILTKL